VLAVAMGPYGIPGGLVVYAHSALGKLSPLRFFRKIPSDTYNRRLKPLKPNDK